MSALAASRAQKSTLGNGLKVAIAPLPHLHTVSIVLGVRVGSRHEPRELNGISHFLEHMLFRGTAEHPSALEFNLAVEELGGTLRAATRADYTTYELTLPPVHAGEGLAIMSELLGPPELRNLDLEKGIVREEILEGLDEEGRDIDPDDLAHRALFGAHPLGLKIAGTEATLARFDEALLRAWHRDHYGASNCAIAIAGAIEPGAIAAVVSERFGSLRAGEVRVPPPVSALEPGPRFTYVESTGSQTDVRVILPSVSERDPLQPATDLLGRVLDDGMSTRLFRTVVEDTGLAYDTFGGYEPYEDVGLFSVGASIEHAKTARLVRTVLGLLTELRDGTIEPRELAKAKKRALFELEAVLDDAEGIAGLLAAEDLFGIDLSVEGLRARTEAVTLADLETAARATLRPQHLQVIAVGSLPESIERESARIVAAFR